MRYPLLALSLIACIDDPELAETEQSVRVYETTYQSVNDTSPLKQVDAVCPPGLIVTQVGIQQSTTYQSVATAMRPANGGQRWTIYARDFFGEQSPWHFNARTKCIAPPAGYELVTARGAFDTASTQTLQLSCPLGKIVLNALFHPVEFSLHGGTSPVPAVLTYSMLGATTWEMRAHALTGNLWSLQGTLVCASPVAGSRMVTGRRVAGTTSAVGCSSSEINVGGGWALYAGTGGGAITEGVVTDEELGSNRREVTVRPFTLAADLSTRGFAICLPTPPD